MVKNPEKYTFVSLYDEKSVKCKKVKNEIL